ncbi:MAG: DUF4416 family protein [Candidatus Omnitrophota bacterium]
MGKILKPLPVKLIIGLIGKDAACFEKSIRTLARKYGKIDFKSQIFDFNLTLYYENEMGKGLKRQFLSFKELISPELLPDIKHFTNRIENKLATSDLKRTINIDPGYITLSKLILATTKNFAHRIYVKKGIFEEITLYFKNNTFTHGKWTYPDYASASHITVFNEIRGLYYKQLSDKYGHSKLYHCV